MGKSEKGIIRSLDRKGSKSKKGAPVAAKRQRPEAALQDPSVCERCGAVYAARKWRRAGKVSHETLARAAYIVCPACAEKKSGIAYGKLVASGDFVRENLDVLRRRMANVERRAGYTQPERRILSADFDGEKLEVLTTSQRLAHRIAHEFEKLFGGKVRYNWSPNDGSLYATWQR